MRQISETEWWKTPLDDRLSEELIVWFERDGVGAPAGWYVFTADQKEGDKDYYLQANWWVLP